ncbi:3'-5' exonuclease [Mumia sp. DW29H23]|uniref:3'-5' exonuclease n=1 Tax=Mumia sp. DW29H23 TaxID=3421241 RepID=UPI003D698509
MSDRPIVAIDCETTGLDPDRHDVFEVAYQRLGLDEEPTTVWLSHSLADASPRALRINRYADRWPYGTTEPTTNGGDGSWPTTSTLDLRRAIDGAHILGANPAFDVAFLQKRLKVATWHHRLIDIEAYAMGFFGWSLPRGLRDIADEFAQLGHDIPAPDHSAAGDVRTLVACWQAFGVTPSARQAEGV